MGVNKKKLATMLLAGSLVATTLIGGTLAFLTDKEGTTNKFQVGKVDVVLEETFDEDALLIPSTNQNAGGSKENRVEKRVDVSLKDGADVVDTYVRVHVAIPEVLASYTNAAKKTYQPLHYNHATTSAYGNYWTWGKDMTSKLYDNMYNTTIDGVAYRVYVATYKDKLSSTGDTKTKYDAIHSVYMDQAVTPEDLADINSKLGDAGWNLKIAVEGVQADEFATPFEAFAAAYPALSDSYVADFDTVNAADPTKDDVVITDPTPVVTP
ncbi:MAG: hypothetical protein EOM40_07160 [Clostridia bacterium]|nr:hypothetical protein [Clostridia bacterium]NCC42341.1 hypothetical protein [Clostridia bacterium]